MVRLRRNNPLRRIMRKALVAAGLDTAVNLGARCGKIAHAASDLYRARARKHLAQVHGLTASNRERNRIVLSMFENMGRSAAEVATMHAWSREDFETRIDMSQLERLAALDPERGILFITAHLGSWELLAAAAALYLPRAIGVVARTSHNEGLEQILDQQRASRNVRAIHRGKSGRDLIGFLRNRGTLGILADMDSKSARGIFVDFLGRPARTPVGPFWLAAISGAVPITGCITRTSCGRKHRIVIGEPIEVPRDVDPRDRDAEREFTIAYSNAIERYIMAAPSEWVWFHERWKRKPPLP